MLLDVEDSPIGIELLFDIIALDGALTERLRGGLQNLLNGFDSHTCLHLFKIHARMVEFGRHERLKIS